MVGDIAVGAKGAFEVVYENRLLFQQQPVAVVCPVFIDNQETEQQRPTKQDDGQVVLKALSLFE